MIEDSSVKIIVNAADARKLLKFGNTIVDIKSKKDFPTETVFIFKADEKFWKDFNGLESK